MPKPSAAVKGARTLEHRKLSELKPFAQNPRTHSDEQVKQIAESIKRFGFTNPILLDGANGVLAGHGRILAAQLLNLETVPCIDLHGLSKAEQRAYIIADNKLALNAGWDNALLQIAFADLEAEGIPLDVTGFTEAEYAAIIGQNVVDDPQGQWGGMPEFNQPDATAFRSVIIHFKDAEAVEQFQQVTGLKFTDKTKMTWYPETEIFKGTQYRYAAETESQQ